MHDQDQEVMAIFVEESQEHLVGLENDLLALEDHDFSEDPEVVNKIFRAVHSIKGSAGFLGLDNIKRLAHEMENIVGMIRSGDIGPSPEVVNELLQAGDQLRELIANVSSSNSLDISGLLTALAGLVAPPPGDLDITPSPAPAASYTDISIGPGQIPICLPGGRVCFAIDAATLAAELEFGKYFYLVELESLTYTNKTPEALLQAFEAIEESGAIIASTIALASLFASPADFAGQPLVILYVTILDPDFVVALFPVAPAQIHPITEDIRTQLASRQDQRLPITLVPESVPDAPPAPPLAPASHLSPPPPVAVPSPPQAAPPAVPSKPGSGADSAHQDTSLRVQVSLLDTLMTLAGELVLGRNQLLQAMARQDLSVLNAVTQKIHLVTSELQEAIMLTRMQPVGLIFNKFPRLIRDLGRNLGKEVELTLDGKEVELDKTIIENISDPLTHLIRNAVDHGIEPPAQRLQLGKSPTGHIALRAYHEAGLVNISIQDDGRGIDPNKIAAQALSQGLITEEQRRTMSDKEKLHLIFRPGLSTAESVTDVSGRGVGMDVVKSNLDKLGGQVEIDSRPGSGTAIKIKLPLTLAIIPSLIVDGGGERFAIPQVSVQELLRIPAAQVKDRLEQVGDAPVLRLRGQILPLISLADVLGMSRQYRDPCDGTIKIDRRRNLADRRSRRLPLFPEAEATSPPADPPAGPASPAEEPLTDQRQLTDRRCHAASALRLAVVDAGTLQYGLVVDELHGTEEIVVKPLGAHFKSCQGYAGATIMGDGKVALILDVVQLAQKAGLTSLAGIERLTAKAQETSGSSIAERHAFLLFRHAPDEHLAIPLFLVKRVDQLKASAIETVAGTKVIQYQDQSLPVFALEEVLSLAPSPTDDLLVIVVEIAGREAGLIAAPPVEALEVSAKLDDVTVKQPGILGSAIINGHTTMVLDVFKFLQLLKPDWFTDRPVAPTHPEMQPTLLLAEDSGFFRKHVKGALMEAGYQVLDAEDGQKAWETLEKHPQEISLVVTDVEMPRLTGLELTAKIKGDPRFRHLPVIALTSLAGAEDLQRGQQAGVDDYQVKLDREKLLASVAQFLPSPD